MEGLCYNTIILLRNEKKNRSYCSQCIELGRQITGIYGKWYIKDIDYYRIRWLKNNQGLKKKKNTTIHTVSQNNSAAQKCRERTYFNNKTCANFCAAAIIKPDNQHNTITNVEKFMIKKTRPMKRDYASTTILSTKPSFFGIATRINMTKKILKTCSGHQIENNSNIHHLACLRSTPSRHRMHDKWSACLGRPCVQTC